MTLSLIRRVKSPKGTVHQLGHKRKWGKLLCFCGHVYEPDHGWEPSSDPLDCGNCLLRIAQASERARAEVAS